MATCPKYNRAMVPSFTDKEEFEELIRWLYDTTTDPTTKTLYNEAYSISIWIPFRFEDTVWCAHYSKFIILVIVKLKDNLQTSMMGRGLIQK